MSHYDCNKCHEQIDECVCVKTRGSSMDIEDMLKIKRDIIISDARLIPRNNYCIVFGSYVNEEGIDMMIRTSRVAKIYSIGDELYIETLNSVYKIDGDLSLNTED